SEEPGREQPVDRALGRRTQPTARTPVAFLQARPARSDATRARIVRPCRKHGSVPMLIRIGYDIELAVATPMALIYLLRVHPSRRDDLVAPESGQVRGGLRPEEYIDSFGNHSGRVNVPVGMSTVRITND